MPKNKQPAIISADPIISIYDSVVTSVRRTITSDDVIVDVELRFKSVSIEKKGVFFRSNQKHSAAELMLSTRVRR